MVGEIASCSNLSYHLSSLMSFLRRILHHYIAGTFQGLDSQLFLAITSYP